MDKNKEGGLLSLNVARVWIRSAQCLRQDTACSPSSLRLAGVGAAVSAVWAAQRWGGTACLRGMASREPEGTCRLAAGRYARLLSPGGPKAGDGSGKRSS